MKTYFNNIQSDNVKKYIQDNNDDSPQSYHKLLRRQLDKTDLNPDSLPIDFQGWEAFLKRINNAYQDADHDRYRLERSMSISSREITELNDKLMHAQSIANMGYWLCNPKTTEIYWSNDAVNVLGKDFTSSIKNYMDLIAQVDHKKYDIDTDLEVTFKNIDDKIDFEICLNKDLDKKKHYHFMLTVSSNNDGNDNSLMGIVKDISLRKDYEEKVKILNRQLITSARDVGRADISTSVLHNIGNVLNSVTTSVGLLGQISEEKLITGINFSNHNIKINNISNFDNEILIDEAKLSQILVNLICNAKDAIIMHYENNNLHADGELIIETTSSTEDPNIILLTIKDNGIGISESQLSKVFTFGYTSKPHGHGFGLHSSIIAAKEMNGELTVSSPGFNQGCVFTLKLNI